MALNSDNEQKSGDGYKRQKQKGLSREITRRLKIQNKKLLEQVSLLKIQLRALKSEKKEIEIQLTRQTNLNNSVAGAFGSCSKCWGGDPHCSNCSGNGSPGWRHIDRGLFNMHILPTLVKLEGLNRNVKKMRS